MNLASGVCVQFFLRTSPCSLAAQARRTSGPAPGRALPSVLPQSSSWVSRGGAFKLKRGSAGAEDDPPNSLLVCRTPSAAVKWDRLCCPLTVSPPDAPSGPRCCHGSQRTFFIVGFTGTKSPAPPQERSSRGEPSGHKSGSRPSPTGSAPERSAARRAASTRKSGPSPSSWR